MNLLVCSVASAAALVPCPQTDDGVTLSLANNAEVTLHASWEPVTEWAMAVPGVPECEELLNVEPAERVRTYTGADLAPFLPDGPVAVGDVWSVPRKAVVRLLEQFHPGATAFMHHSPAAIAGTWGTLRAVSERYAEILTSSHADFLFEPDIWFTPGQFEGRLVIDRSDGSIASYRLHVPVRMSNVDVNVPTAETRKMGNNLGLPGIGLIPRMELASATTGQAVAWTESVSDEEARAALRHRFYGDAKWTPFAEAVALSEAQGKPLHALVLLGTLDDESC